MNGQWQAPFLYDLSWVGIKMKILKINKRHLYLLLSSFLIVFFQNCGQPGSIALNDSIESQSQLAVDPIGEDSDEVETPPSAPQPHPPAGEVGYKEYIKPLVVSAFSSKVDVLVVIDNSGSMSYEQGNMAGRFSSFLERLKGLDYQVGIVTTDVKTNRTSSYRKDGRLLPFAAFNNRYWIKSTDNAEDAKNAFADVIERSELGSGQEQGVKATYRALERSLDPNDNNYGFFRPGAALSVILVTDSDETTSDSTYPGDVNYFTEKNHPENLVNFVQKNFSGKSFKFNSIIVRDNDANCLEFPNSENEAYGRNYQKLTNMTSGILGSVCESDYAGQLSVIGDSTAENVKVVTLDCDPVDSDKNGAVNLVVKDQNNVEQKNFTLKGRVLSFDKPLSVGKYSFAYTCLIK